MSALHELPDPPSDAISSLRFSPAGNKLAVSSWDRTVSIYHHSPDSEAPFVRQTGIQCRAPILDVCWGDDDTTLFAVGLDQDVRLLHTEADNPDQEVLSTHTAPSNKLVYSRDHSLLISTSWDSTMHIHHPPTHQYIRVRLAAKPFALSLTSSRLVVAMAERKVSVYDLHALRALLDQTGGSSAREDLLDVTPWQQRESSLKFMTRALSCMPDGTGFATSSIEGRVGVEWFDPEDQKRTYAFKCHRQTSTVPASASAAEGAEGPEGGVAGEEDQQAQQEIDIVYPVNALSFHPLHGTFATGGGDGVVALWDANTKRRIKQYGKLGASIAALDFSSHDGGSFLAVAASPGFEDGQEDTEPDPSLVRVFVRVLAEGEAKGKPAK
ncbi:putative nuclear pore complex subunit [Hortaea werneckii]|nr:putative nuclear pore complex subunit [Hortaea werneckii]